MLERGVRVTRISSRPRVIRATSSRSSRRRPITVACRFTICRALSLASCASPSRSSRSAAVRKALSGLRSSCDSVARKSSLARAASLSSSLIDWVSSSCSRSWYWRSLARNAACTALTMLRTCAGRSSRTTPAALSREGGRGESARASIRMGSSDQEGCRSNKDPRSLCCCPRAKSSVRMTAPAPRRISRIRSDSVSQISPLTPASLSTRRVTSASALVGASTRTLVSARREFHHALSDTGRNVGVPVSKP